MNNTHQETAYPSRAPLKAADLRRLAELSPARRARLLGKDFDLDEAMASKKSRRRLLAELSLPDKLRMWQEMLEASRLRRGTHHSPPVKQPPRYGGGLATAKGVGYEDRVAAWLGVKMLSGASARLWEGLTGADLATITMQAAEPVDDVVVTLSDRSAGGIFISAKMRSRPVSLTYRSAAFAEPVTAFIRQFLKLAPASRKTCWLVWAIPSSAGVEAGVSLRRALDNLRLADDALAPGQFAAIRPSKEAQALRKLLDVATRIWPEVAGLSATVGEMGEFIRRLRVQVFDPDEDAETVAAAQVSLADNVILDPTRAWQAWSALVGIFADVNERGTPVTRTVLRKALAAVNVSLKPPPGYAGEIDRLQRLTERNLSRLSVHDTLRFGANPADAVHIDRTRERTALHQAALMDGGLLVTGEPGSGKSGLVYSLAKELQEQGIPTVLLLAEEIFARDWKGAATLPGFDRHPLDEILSHWPASTPGVLLTDALDAVRDPDLQRMLRELLADVRRGSSGWRVVASVREFDLDHGQELRKLFPGQGTPGFASARFSAVAHFHVPRLSDKQLDALTGQREEIGPFIREARRSPRSEDIHRSPFYLRLAADLIGSGVAPARVADWHSPAVLLRKFWEERVATGPAAAQCRATIRTICRKMVDERTLTLSEAELSLQPADHEGIRELRARGVLALGERVQGTSIGGDILSFTHHLLHDFAVSAELIPKIPARFVSFTVKEPVLSILYRQSFLFALEEIWDAGGTAGNRADFWSVVLHLEDAPSLYSITRIQAPVLAARRVASFHDLEGLLEKLISTPGQGTPAHRAFRHLVSGLQDAHDDTVRNGAAGWLEFAEKLSALLSGNEALEWPLILLLDRLNALDAQAPLPAHLSLNTAGRNLLRYCLTRGLPLPRQYSMNVAIVAVCQSFDAASAESRDALLTLLTPARVELFPHDDLRQLAGGLKHLGGKAPAVVLRLFEVVFSTQPARGEWEDRGPILTSLRFQTIDQWNSIRHNLVRYFQTLGGDHPGLLTRLACIVLNENAAQTPRTGDAALFVLATIRFRGVDCALVEDYAHIRGYSFEHDGSATAAHFEELLRGWAAADYPTRLHEALDHFAVHNRTSSLWSLFLKIGAEYPATLGRLLEPILTEPVFFTQLDYRYAGTRLFGVLHEAGDQEQRERLEHLILALPTRAYPWRSLEPDALAGWLRSAEDRLLGVLDPARIVLPEIQTMKVAREASGPLPANDPPRGLDIREHTYTEEEIAEEQGILLTDPVNLEMFQFRQELKHFLGENRIPASPENIEAHWPAIARCEAILADSSLSHPQMAAELWGYLVGACRSTATVMEWPPADPRWETVRRILLRASTDPEPHADNLPDADAAATAAGTQPDESLAWGWPAPRIDAAQGLPFLAYRTHAADEPLRSALRRLSRDGSYPLRFNLAERLSLLREPTPGLMWELLDAMAGSDPSLMVLVAVVQSLDRLWWDNEDRVHRVLDVIAARAARANLPEHPLDASLAGAHLFHHLQTGSEPSRAYVAMLIEQCDEARNDHALRDQLHGCRAGGWLTAGDAVTPDPDGDAVRGRAWRFFFDLLSAAQGHLGGILSALEALGPSAAFESEPARSLVDQRNRVMGLADAVAAQIYFASGAFADKQQRDAEQLSLPQLRRFWKESEPCLRVLAEAAHPSVAYHLVQTFDHLLPCDPREIFLLATHSIRRSADQGGFQYEPQAVAEVVKLAQRILADHAALLRDPDGGISECFEALLGVLDVFVEAGWSEARQLTHRLEDIYR